MDYEDIVMELYGGDGFDEFYRELSDSQKNIVNEIIARHEFDEDEFQELITDPQYYDQ